MKAWIKLLIGGGILIVALLIIVPNLLTTRHLHAAQRANEQLRIELEAVGGELEEMRGTLATTTAENLALREELGDSWDTLQELRTAIDKSFAVTGEFGETNQELIELIRESIFLVGELRGLIQRYFNSLG